MTHFRSLKTTGTVACLALAIGTLTFGVQPVWSSPPGGPVPLPQPFGQAGGMTPNLYPLGQEPESLGTDDGTTGEVGTPGPETPEPETPEPHAPPPETPEPETPAPETPGIGSIRVPASARDYGGSAEDADMTVSTAKTDSIVGHLALGRESCSTYYSNIRIDCLRDELQSAAKSLPTSGDYADMRKTLLQAADKLDRIVTENADPTAPVHRYRTQTSQGARMSRSPIRAIAPDRLNRANAQANAVMEELSTTLLRSAASSARKQVHFERAAQAVDGMKVLLRSI